MFSFLFRPTVFSLGLFLLSLAALVFALVAQYAYNLEPCILCYYQRIPFVLTAILSLTACKLSMKGMNNGFLFITILTGLIFLVNAGIAFYHVGVEQKWWVSAVEGCKINTENLAQSMLQPAVSCDEIAWQFLGISMAGYNLMLCGILGLVCLAYTRRHKKSASIESKT